MDLLVIDYRDPLFSVIALLLVVLVVFLANYTWEQIRKKDENKKISDFLKKFEGTKKDQDYKEILSDNPSSVKSLVLMASNYSKNGLHSEAIKVYLALLEAVQDKAIRADVMTLLGRTYFKAGFMQRSRDILLETLKIKARNKEALELLAVIYESIKDYKKTLDVLESLSQLDVDVTKSKEYIQLTLVVNSPTFTISKKVEKIVEIYNAKPHLFREIYRFLFEIDSSWAMNLLKENEVLEIIDILWLLPKDILLDEFINKYQILQEIYSAKGFLDLVTQSSVFELDILIKLKENRDIADLEFEYTCNSCGVEFPVYFGRCPSCFDVSCMSVKPVIVSNKGDGFEASANFH